MRKVLIVGATSAIAEATARRLAARKDRLFLVARNADRLNAVAADLKLRGADCVGAAVMNVLEYQRHSALLEQAAEALDGLDTVLIAHGTLPDQPLCEASFVPTREALEVNLMSVLSLLTHAANRFERQSQGTIAVISSVAGDRGRRSNYVYGTAKGALTIFLQGLRHRLHKAGVRVVTVKPGFVDTPMTADFPKGLLWVSPEVVARGLVGALDGGPTEIYLPRFWRWIMLIIRAIPGPIFYRLPL
jgi:decaprenylphospho-beta-D-erythro-pentofuranosid-2-ulose 2-reductase